MSVPWCNDTGMALSGTTLKLYSTRQVSYLGRFVSWTATVQKPTYTHTYYLVAGTLLILAQTPVDPRRRLALPRRFRHDVIRFLKPRTATEPASCIVLFFLDTTTIKLLILVQYILLSLQILWFSIWSH